MFVVYIYQMMEVFFVAETLVFDAAGDLVKNHYFPTLIRFD